MTAQKRVIKHECKCFVCDFCWRSTDTFSVCPICGKEVIAKTMITEVIKEEEGEMNFIEKEFIEHLVWKMQENKDGGFVIVDVCPRCGKLNIEVCKHDSCYNNQCKCGYLTGFIGRNHAN